MSAWPFPFINLLPHADIFSAVHSSSVTYGVVPFENSTNGSVVYTLDLLIDREDRFPSITVCGEAYMDVHHCLLGCVGRPNHAHSDPTPSSDGSRTPTTHVPHPNPPRARPLKDLRHIKRIYSHPQAFGQCEAFLSTYLKGIERQEVSSTSKAAEIVAADSSRTTAAISSKLAADIHGLTLLSEGIEDSEDNTTRFLILQKLEEIKLPNGMSNLFDQSYLRGTSLPQRFKSLVAFKIDHNSSGALAKALAVFGNHGLNLTSINSRPSREHPWHYVFLVEFEGKRAASDEGEVNAALQELDKPTQGWKWLGSWVDKMSRPSTRSN
ncbi:prephenate dehydratase [Physcia stellaris]|nr:prephenate dehydratase [Physcia stellaris]